MNLPTGIGRVEPEELAAEGGGGRTRPPWTPRASGTLALASLSVLAVLGATLLAENRTLGPGRVLCAVLVAVWAVCAVFVGSRRPREPLGLLMAMVAIVGAAVVLGAALHARPEATDGARDLGAKMRALGIAALPAVLFHVALGMPDGVLRTRARRALAALGYATAAVVATGLLGTRPRLRSWPVVLEACGFAIVGIVAVVRRYRTTDMATERARLRWAGGSVVAAVVVAGVAWALHELVAWPEPVRTVAVAGTALVPIALALGTSERVLALAYGWLGERLGTARRLVGRGSGRAGARRG